MRLSRRLPESRWTRWLLWCAVLLVGVVLALISDVVADGVKDAVGGIHLNLPAYVFVPAALIFLAVVGFLAQRLSDWAALLRRPADDVDASEQVDEQAERIARDRLRAKLCRDYASILKQSLIGEIPVEPSFDEQPTAVEHPLAGALERRGEAPAAPRRGTPRTAYDEQGGPTGDGLLILGDAGTGKSVALVKLALDVAKRAESDPLQPLPVYVTLSSWKTGREFDAWFANQAQRLHGIRPSVARRWLRAGMLVPFLDGLDEIRDPDDRVDCVTAINALRQEADLGVVVTCRQADYLDLRTRLRLGTALVIRRLDSDELLDDLRSGGPALAGVLSAAERDADLLELIRTPLMLGVTLIAYRGREVDAPHATGSASRYDHVLTAYVDRRFETREQQRPGRGDYPRERTTRWLAVIASNLDRRNDSAFFVERLQPDWVPSTRVMHVVGAAPGIVGGGLAALILCSPLLSLGSDIPVLLYVYLLIFACVGLTWPLFLLLTGGLDDTTEITPTERFRWSWRAAWEVLPLPAGVTAFAGFTMSWWAWLEDGPMAAAIMFVCLEFVALVPIALGVGLVPVALDTRVAPNHGIRLSLRNGLVVGGLTALAVGVPLLVLLAALYSLASGMIVAAIVGSLAGLGVAFARGLAPAIAHATLRLVLWRRHMAPLRYVRWLEHAVELRLLYRGPGGGYVFIHGLLQEHFAAMAPAQPQPADKDAPAVPEPDAPRGSPAA